MTFFKKCHSARKCFLWILLHYNTIPNHMNFSFEAGGKSRKIFFHLWPWEVKSHFKVMNKKWIDSDRSGNYLAFGENRSLLSWLEPELCPLEDKMLSRNLDLRWPLSLTLEFTGCWKWVCEVDWCGVTLTSIPNMSQIERGRCQNGLNLIDLT